MIPSPVLAQYEFHEIFALIVTWSHCDLQYELSGSCHTLRVSTALLLLNVVQLLNAQFDLLSDLVYVVFTVRAMPARY